VRVVVVGAGTGGLALAAGLQHRGHEVVVLERASALRTGGAAVTLWSNGTAALQALADVDPTPHGRVLTGLETRTPQGRRVMRVDVASLSARLGSPTACVPRDRLVMLLAGLLPDGTIRFGHQVTGVETGAGSDGARVLLADGRQYSAELVVGADGSGSALRGALLPEVTPQPTGWTSWQGLTRVLPDVAARSTALGVLGPQGYVGLIPAGDGLLQWWFDVPDRPTSDGSALAALRARFASWPGPVAELLRTLDDETLTPWEHLSQPVARTWGRGAVTLLGDAAHTMPPSLSQGVNSTLQDAALLTRSLDAVSAGRPLAPVLRHYEATRARQVRPVARLAASESSITYRRSSTAAMRLMPDALAGAVYGQLIRRSSPALSTARRPPTAPR